LLLTTAIFLSDSTFRFRSYHRQVRRSAGRPEDDRMGIEALVSRSIFSARPRKLLDLYDIELRGAFFSVVHLHLPEAPNPLFSFIAAVRWPSFSFISSACSTATARCQWCGGYRVHCGTDDRVASAYYFVPSFGHMWLWHGSFYGPVNRLRGVTSSANVIGAAVASGTLLMAILLARVAGPSPAQALGLLFMSYGSLPQR